MKKIEAVIRPEKLETVQQALTAAGFAGFMVLDVRGHGGEAAPVGEYRGTPFSLSVKHKLVVELVVDDAEVPVVVDAIAGAARTGQVGDGLILVTEVAQVYQIRTGAWNYEAVLYPPTPTV